MKNRIQALLLIAAMLAALLTGCGSGAADDAQEEQDLQTSKYTYLAERLDFEVDDAYQLQGIDGVCISGNYVFFYGTAITGKEVSVNQLTGEPVLNAETGEPVEVNIYETLLFRMDLTSRETVRLDYQPAEPPEGMLGSSYIIKLAAGLDGTFWLMESMNTYSYDLPEDFDAENDKAANYYKAGERIKTLCQYNADGTVQKTVYVSELGDLDIQQILFDQDGNIYINTYDMIYLLNSEGALLTELQNPSWGPIYQLSASKIVAASVQLGVRSFYLIDPAIPGLGETLEVANNASALYPGMGDYEYFYEDSWKVIDLDNVYGYRNETDGPEKLFSWLDCDVDRDDIVAFTILEDGRVAAVTVDSSRTISYGMLFLEPADPSELPQKQELTLACMSLLPDIRSAVTEFNQSQSSVRIVVKDYAVYNVNGDTTAGLTRLNTELLSGKIPDIICTDSLPVDQYAAKGLLTDLWPLIDGDETLSREDLMTHLFDVLSTEDKLYQIAGAFWISTAVGNADVIGDRTSWTLEELMEVMKTMPDGATVDGEALTKNNALVFCIERNLGDFIDWDTQTCSFDSPEFIEILKFADMFRPENKGGTSESERERFKTGKQLFMTMGIFDFAWMQVISAIVGGNPCYVGYPSFTGSGSSLCITGGMAITSACQDVDAAWSFLRTFLTEDYQKQYISVFGQYLPTNRHSFEALAEEAMTPNYEPDVWTLEETEASYGTWYLEDGSSVEIWAASQEDYDTLMRLYESCDSLYTGNNIICNIIEAEAAPFFDGQKTAEEAAALIQNRVGLYVMEQK